jgi:hypothetical protein
MTARTAVVLTVCLLVSLKTHLDAQAGNRTLMHAFEEDSQVVAVAISDLPSGPQGVVMSQDSSSEKRSFAVSKAEFESMWTTLMSTDMDQYARNEKSVNLLTALVGYAAHYIFTVHMADGTKKYYAVPKDEASRRLAALAAQLRAYTR